MSNSKQIWEALYAYAPAYSGFVYGIEIEAEGIGLPAPTPVYDEDGDELLDTEYPQLGAWETHEEGSISGAEYVLSHPLPIEEAEVAVLDLWHRLTKQHRAVLHSSPRTSVHIHVNCGDNSIAWLRKALPVLAYAEQFLIHHSGQHRRGNLFCLSRLEAPFAWTPIMNVVAGLKATQHDTKYSAVNFVPLWSTGSIEFRMMRGLTKASEVLIWLRMIDTLMNATDDIANDFDFSEVPAALTFLEHEVGLAPMWPKKINELRKRGLRSATEVLAGLEILEEIAKATPQQPKTKALPNIWETSFTPTWSSSLSSTVSLSNGIVTMDIESSLSN